MALLEDRLQDVLLLIFFAANTCVACGKTSTAGTQPSQSGTGGSGSVPVTNDIDATSGIQLPSGCAPPGAYECNPVTNQGCNATAGEACDDDLNGGFTCYAPPNDVPLRGACNIVDGPSCRPGAVCRGADDTNPNGICAPYCCSDRDCGSDTTCHVLDSQYGSLGYCA